MNEFERRLAFRASAEELALVRTLPVEALPSISVVIPSFNQASWLPATLDSVLSQHYPKMDVFVADGGSTDGSEEILADYQARHPELLRYDCRPDGGHWQGVNKGIANTRGDVVAWINSDDLYLLDCFWKVATFFHFNRCALVMYGGNRYVRDDGSLLAEYPADWSPLLREQARRMMHFCTIPQPSLFFRREAVAACGALGHELLDYELWLRWQRDLPFFFFDDVLSLSRVHPEAISARADHRFLGRICRLVHDHYGWVPLSWVLRLVHTRRYGAAWARGESPPFTSAMRFEALGRWAAMNIGWAPARWMRSMWRFRDGLRQALRGSA